MSSSDEELATPSSGKLDKETAELISRVFEKCTLGLRRFENIVLPKENMMRAIHYTGLHPHYLRFLRNSATGALTVMPVRRFDIQNEMLAFYHNSKLPTTYELFYRLHDEGIPKYMDIRSFRRMLVKFGYMWRKISKNVLVVIERPQVTFERYFYLKNIIQYREKSRQIYFVDELILTSTCEVFNGDVYEELKDYVSPDILLKHVIYTITDNSVKFITYFDNYDPSNVETWLQLKLFRLVKPESIIVLRNKKHMSQELLVKPTVDSLKIEMKDWLDFYNVPYDDNFSKIELYTLVEKFTNNIGKLYKVDSIAKTADAEVLRLPESINDLTPAYWLYQLLRKNVIKDENTNFFQLFQNIIGTADEHLIKYNEYITDEEKKTLDTDMQIDKIMDNLVESMKSTSTEDLAEDSDLPYYSDSD